MAETNKGIYYPTFAEVGEETYDGPVKMKMMAESIDPLLLSDEDKTKLDNIEAGAEVNVIESVKVNGTALTITDKAVDVPVPTKTSDLTNDSGFGTYSKPNGGIPSTDLSSAVQTSLGKADTAVQDVSGKEDKSNKVTSISSSSTNTQYPSAKLLYDKLAEKQEQIDALVEENSTLKKQQLKGQASGSSIQLTYSAEGLEIENVVIKGATEQAQYEGKNLYNVNTSKSSSESTIIYDDYSVLTTNNTGSSTRYTPDYKTVSTDLQTNTDYWAVIEIKAVSGEGQIYFFSNLADSTKGQFITNVLYSFANLTAGQKIKAKVTTRDSFDGCTSFARKIAAFSAGKSGSITYRISVLANEPDLSTFEYEPYCGAQVSPNKDYPQEVHCVTGTNVVEEKNKNWIKTTDGTRSSNGISAIVKNGVATLNGTATATSMIYITLENPLTFKANVRYKLSANNNNIAGTDINVCGVRFGGDMSTIAKFKNQNGTCTFYFEQDTSFNQICIRTNEGITYENFVIKPQLEIGTASTDFVEGEYQNIPLTLGNIELYDGDKITIAYVEEAGKKKLTSANIVKAINTSITWRIGEAQKFEDSTVFWSNARDGKRTSDRIILCSHLSKVSNTYDQEKTGIELHPGTGEVGVRVPKEIASTLAEFNSWISNNNVKFAYSLAEPKTVKITDTTLLSQLETLINMKTYKQITNIETTGSDLAPVLEFKYSKDLQTVIDNMQAQILS